LVLKLGPQANLSRPPNHYFGSKYQCEIIFHEVRNQRTACCPTDREALPSNIFAIGYTVAIAVPNGKPVPWIAPTAKPQGQYVAETLKARLRGETIAPFQYKHAGSLAQIGKRKAVIDFGRFKLRGTIAWWIWGSARRTAARWCADGICIRGRQRALVAFRWRFVGSSHAESVLSRP
jgi:NADH dehydrogenase FAD-containing subunit